MKTDHISKNIPEENNTLRKILEEKQEQLTFFDSILFSSFDLSIVATDINLNIVFINSTAEKYHELAASFVIGKTLSEIHEMKNVDSGKINKVIEIVKKEGVYNYNNERKTDDGIKYFSSTIKGIKKRNNELIGYILMTKDETQKVLYERKQKDDIAKLNLVFENSTDVILQLDINGILEYCSPSIENIFLYEPHIMIGTNILHFFHKDNAAKLSRTFQQVKKTKKTHKIDLQFTSKYGNVKYIKVKVKPYIIERDPIGFHCIMKDYTEMFHNEEKFTNVLLDYERMMVESHLLNEKLEMEVIERKKIEKELIQSRKNADTANASKSEYLANMSHEIRTPLNAILGFSEILKEKLIDSPQYSEYLSGISSSGKSLLTLINDILDLSKIEAGHLEIRLEPINPALIVYELKQIFLMNIRSKGLELIINIHPQLHSSLLLDHMRIRQVLLNLIGNAIKFTSYGSITISIKSEIKPETKDKVDLFIEVKDTGIGIKEDQLKIIFDAFKQQDGQSPEKFGGTGLGLTITQQLVKMMNGIVSVESTTGKGSVFKIHLIDVDVADTDTGFEDNSINEIKSIQFRGSKILLVEDIESNRQVVRGYLENHNITLFEAENGEKAIQKVKAFSPDLIIMDIQMPVMDGLEASKRIKADSKFNKIPIIALTASVINTKIEKVKAICEAYMTKPISKHLLIKTLAEFLPHSKTDKQNIETVKTSLTYPEMLNEHLKNFESLPVGLVNIFKKELSVLYNEISEYLDINDITHFSRMIIESAEKYNIIELKNYGDELMISARMFKVNEIKRIISAFPDLKKIILEH